MKNQERCRILKVLSPFWALQRELPLDSLLTSSLPFVCLIYWVVFLPSCWWRQSWKHHQQPPDAVGVNRIKRRWLIQSTWCNVCFNSQDQCHHSIETGNTCNDTIIRERERVEIKLSKQKIETPQGYQPPPSVALTSSILWVDSNAAVSKARITFLSLSL